MKNTLSFYSNKRCYCKMKSFFYTTALKFVCVVYWYDVVVVCVVVQRQIWFLDNNFSSSEWISMKFLPEGSVPQKEGWD